jgi:hemin uptake protein HemP
MRGEHSGRGSQPAPGQGQRARGESGEGEAGPLQRIDVQDLFIGRRELILVHKGAEYLLRVTSNDKLILTK